MSSQKTTQETFDKAIELLEKKLHTKVKTAILTVRTEDGEFEVFKGNRDNIIIMQLGSVQIKIANLLQRPLQANQIVICSLCGGSGRDLENSFKPCEVCRGGGQVVLVNNSEEGD
jgi:hypothetical protein